MDLHKFLLIAAAVCFALAAVGISSPVGLVPLGLAFFAAGHLVA